MTERKYIFKPDKRYLTAGINNEVPLAIQMLLWNYIDTRISSKAKMDYLQVFTFEAKDDALHITHKQEAPPYEKTRHKFYIFCILKST